MNSEPQSILLLSGAGLPAWIWEGVTRELPDRYAATVAARPAHHAGARLRDYAEAALESVPAGPFTVVAHSSGGVTAAEILGLVPERVSAVLAVSAVVPPPGGSFISAMPAPNRWMLDIVMRLAGTRPPASAIRRSLAHGLDDRTTDRIIADFTPESPGLYRNEVARSSWAGRRGYLFTTGDRQLPLSLQRQCAQRLGAAWTEELETGHLPMVEAPQALAASVTRFLGGLPAPGHPAPGQVVGEGLVAPEGARLPGPWSAQGVSR